MILLWHHADRWRETGLATVELRVAGLPFGSERLRVRHWRIDDEHSNAHAAWVRLGRPDDPSPAEVAALKQSQGLQRLDAPDVARLGGGEVATRLKLPLHACSLLELGPA